MTMLHDVADGHDFHYKSKYTIPFLTKMSKSRRYRRSTRKQAAVVLAEVQTLRQRLSEASIECSEWRQKVGGAAYSAPGPKFMWEVERGIVNRIGHYIQLTDEDFYPGS